MKVSKLKGIVDRALRKHYTNKGLYSTADRLRTEIFRAIDRSNTKRHKR